MGTRCSVATAVLMIVGLAIPDGRPRAAEIGELAELVRVERAILPVLLEPARCRAIPADRLVVSEDGVDCRVTAVDVGALPRVHAILVDNSVTMKPLLGRLEKAVSGYLSAVPADEPVVVATFSDNLVLRSPLSTDRASQLEAASDLGLGYRTALLDALSSMIGYLESRPERKIVVLFTDTFDNSSLVVPSDDELLDLAARVPDLSLFTIHLRSRARQLPGSAELLERISIATGGEYFPVSGAGGIEKAFRAIRERLDAEVSVAYVPPSFGAGPLDDSENATYRRRKIEIRVREGGSCRVTLGARSRTSGNLPTATSALEIVELPPGTERAQPTVLDSLCPVGRRRCWTPREILRFPSPAPWPATPPESSQFWLLTPPDHIAGRTLDVTVGRGALYDAALLAEHGRFRLNPKPRTATTVRDFVVETPSLEQLQHRFHSPIDVVERWMKQGGGGPAFFLHGRTWLEIRESLAQALYRSRTDYAAWTDARLDELHVRRVDRLLLRHQGLDETERRQLREVLLENVRRPGDESAARFLAEWLGDVAAAELARGLESRVAGRLPSLSASERVGSLEQLERFWKLFHGWFPPPTAIRVVALLVPNYDQGRDVIGFHRIVFPQPRPDGGPADPVPEHPFGAWMLNRFLSDDRLRGLLPESNAVSGIDYRPVFRTGPGAGRDDGSSDSVGLPGTPRHSAFESSVRLAAAEGEVVLRGLIERSSGPRPAMALRCVRIGSDPPTSPLVRRLRELIESSNLDCGRLSWRPAHDR